MSIGLRFAGAGLVMVLGSAMVGGLLLVLNLGELEPPVVDEKPAVEMDAAPPPEPPQQRARPRPRPRPQPAAAAPSPNLGASLAGLDLGLPAPGMDQVAQGLLGEVENVIHTADTVDAAPRPLQRVAPSYPPRARSKNITGFVTLSLRIGMDGRVEMAKVVQAQPPGVFEDSALEAVRQWQFEPATYEGVPVAVRVQQTLNFSLE